MSKFNVSCSVAPKNLLTPLTLSRRFLSGSIARLFPSQCLLCGCSLAGDSLCTDCQLNLPHIFNRLLCKQCGLTIDSLSNYCGHCLNHPPAFSRSLIPFEYKFPLDTLIHKFKYRADLTAGKALARLLAEAITHQITDAGDLEQPDVIIPVPLHWMRRWRRGFNQAEVLAYRLAHELDIPIATRHVLRVKNSTSQKGLSRRDRQIKLNQPFAINHKYQKEIIGKRIALVDDVVTTTATLRALSSLLMTSGAKDVQVWALARTMSKADS